MDFSWAPSGEPYAGEEVTFTANISELDEDCIMSYEWNFGDSYTASGKTVTHQLAKGNNNITLTLWRAATTGEETTQYAIWANSTTGSPGFKLASLSLSEHLQTCFSRQPNPLSYLLRKWFRQSKLQ